MAYRIMIVEDDAVIARSIAEELARWNMTVRICGDLRAVADECRACDPHLVLMDVSLPFFSGFHWCAEIRRFSRVPILFLSSRAEDMDVVMGMNMGGDEYIAKPVNPSVLVARVQAMLRRTYDYTDNDLLSIGDAVVDAPSSCLRRGEERVPLTRNETRLLSELLTRRGRVVPRETLMMALWDSDEFVDENTLTVNINRLRRKLSAFALDGCITTHKGQGYSIDA